MMLSIRIWRKKCRSFFCEFLDFVKIHENLDFVKFDEILDFAKFDEILDFVKFDEILDFAKFREIFFGLCQILIKNWCQRK
jgi:hypothetical protein